MRKLIITGMAVAMLAVPAVASADVPRCEGSVPTSTTVTTATFTALQPKDTEHQFGNVWKHDFTVTVNADGTFWGSGTTTDNGGSTVVWAESITGSFNSDRSRVSFKTVPVRGGATFKVTDALYNVEVDVDDEGTWPANDIQMMISTPVFTTATTTTPGTESAKNHGQYVSSAGGGKAAAQKCTGMPLNSTQGKQ